MKPREGDQRRARGRFHETHPSVGSDHLRRRTVQPDLAHLMRENPGPEVVVSSAVQVVTMNGEEAWAAHPYILPNHRGVRGFITCELDVP